MRLVSVGIEIRELHIFGERRDGACAVVEVDSALTRLRTQLLKAHFDPTQAHAIAAAIDEKLRPIAETPVDPNDPTWMDRMRQSSPLDEAGVRPEAEALLLCLLEAYASGTSNQRVEIRELFRKNWAFSWAATVPETAATLTGFRLRLLQISALHGVEDPRDLSLNLNSIMETAAAAGVDINPALAEVAALSESPLREVLSRQR